jgi:hypothetical protein
MHKNRSAACAAEQGVRFYMENFLKTLSLLLIYMLILVHFSASADELSERNNIMWSVQEAFENRNFVKLEALSNKYDNEDKRTGSGAQKASLFDDGIYNAFKSNKGASENHIKKVVNVTKKWTIDYSGSSLSHILYARALYEHAYFFRGRGYSNTVSENEWKEFKKYSLLSANYLKKRKDIASLNTRWHVMMINIGRDLKWPIKIMNSIASEGLEINPNDDRIYYWQLEALLPKWGGSSEQVDDFINRVAKATEKSRGMELYARLYSAAEERQYHTQLFRKSKVEWEIMRKGLIDWNRRYPVAWNKNIFAYFSCMAGDKVTAKSLFSDIGDIPILRIWGPNGKKVFSWCKSWAL